MADCLPVPDQRHDEDMVSTCSSTDSDSDNDSFCSMDASDEAEDDTLCFDTEDELVGTTGMDDLLQNAEDLSLHIVSFLGVSDAAKLMAVNRVFHSRVRHSDHLWEQWCRQRWPDQIPKNATIERDNDDDDCTKQQPDFHNLLKLAAKGYPPTCMEVATPSPHVAATTAVPFMFEDCDSSVIARAAPLPDYPYRYAAFRSNHPMPCPNKSLRDRVDDAIFVSPLSTDLGTAILVPRTVSYYEITILPRKVAIGTRLGNEEYTVGIGLCIGDLPETSSCGCGQCGHFPGWDILSFGYHGDNGCIYRGSQEFLRRFASTFGPNDCVGCGVDYLTGSIFFTLNGEFLGDAWENEKDLHLLKLFPTVGMSANTRIRCNFGERDFAFDLSSYKEQASKKMIM